MKQSKIVLLACAFAVLTLTFVAPYLQLGAGIELSLWGIHKLDPSLPHTFAVLICAALAAVIGVAAVVRGKLGRSLSFLALLATGAGTLMAYALFIRTKVPFSDGAIGAKLILAAFVIGGLASLTGMVKPDRG